MKILNWLLVFAGILGIISVRVFEDKIFYDPFLEFFRGDFKALQFPNFEMGALVVSLVFRFFLNLVFSTLIIQFLFQNKEWTLWSILLMGITFLVFLPIYIWCLYSKMEIGYLFTFSVRRFLIQPIILLLIVPIFYYQKRLANKS